MTIGVSYELFWHLNPAKLKPFKTAFENKRKLRDEENWLSWGNYGMSALAVVLSSAFSKNSQVKFMEKPVFSFAKEQQTPMTNEEKIRKTEQLFMQLQLMEANHKLNHKHDSK